VASSMRLWESEARLLQRIASVHDANARPQTRLHPEIWSSTEQLLCGVEVRIADVAFASRTIVRPFKSDGCYQSASAMGPLARRLVVQCSYRGSVD
jgi:hypothetical protein